MSSGYRALATVLLLMLLESGTSRGAEFRTPATGTLDGAAVELNAATDAKLSVTIAPLKGAAADTLALQTPGFSDGAGVRADQPVSVNVFLLGKGASGAWLTFGLDDCNGGSRAVAVLLSRADAASKWVVAREWAADTTALGELGFKREKQTITTADGRIERTLHSLSVEGIAHKLDCGCTACQSRSTELDETETLAWNAASRTFDVQKHEQWYVAQPGENLMAAVRKALGDARRVAHVAKLNPEIPDGAVFKGGERILVLREGGS